MVEGLARFADHFSGFTDQYVLIGGAACDLAMQAAARAFRVTKDLDIVLCLESLSGGFVESFWSFVRDGLYQSQEKEGGQRQFYRFGNPQTLGFPAMLELFARMTDALHFEGQGHLIPLLCTSWGRPKAGNTSTQRKQVCVRCGHTGARRTHSLARRARIIHPSGRSTLGST